MDVVTTRLRSAYPESNARRGVRLESLHDAIVGPSRGRLAMVSVAAIFLLLVVCANVSSLLLERSTQRQREMATRAALGASSAQLMRTLLAESLALAALGLAGALGVAWVVKSLLLTYGPELPRRVDPGLDARTFGIALATTALVGLLFTLVPSLHTLGRGLYRRLRVGLVGASGAAGRRWRSAFVTVQIALAVVLTLGAALLVQSLANLQSVDLGFTHEGVLTVDLEVPTPYVSDRWPETVAFYRDLIDELEEVPGVAAAAAAHQHPAKPGWSTSFTIEGEPTPPTGEKPEANFRPVTPGYFELLDIPLLAGRSYGDAAPPEPVGQVIVNRAFVRRHLGDVAPQRALGRRIIRDCWWNADIKSYDIIGVVADTHFAGRHRRPQPALYLPHRTDAPPRMTVLVRTEPGLAPLAQLDAVREAVLRVDPEMPLGHTATLSELVRDTVDVRRFLTFLLTAFAGVTLALAALGLRRPRLRDGASHPRARLAHGPRRPGPPGSRFDLGRGAAPRRLRAGCGPRRRAVGFTAARVAALRRRARRPGDFPRRRRGARRHR
ncbi:MAG: FtsX-like permease family protein, partial [Acidobacteriota bacterium]